MRTHEQESEPGGGHSARYGGRVLRPDQEGEGERIDLGALAYDEVTLAHLMRLGVGLEPGWRCLDIGAGTGSVARLLLDEAGVDDVVAVDRDIRFLAAHPVPGLTAVEADVTTSDLPRGSFHLVHARFVLMHLPERERMIARLASLVAPGGVLVLGDAIDLTSADAPPTPYTRVMQAMWQGLKASIGTDVSWVCGYPQLLRAVGLTSVGAEVHVPALTPGSAISRFWADTWDRARGAITATGMVDDAAVDEAIRYLASPDCADISAGLITAWGRRPPPTEDRTEGESES
ncbi:SAM-dependent methyltransferase [Streptomyces sp. V4I23]|uniref:class I SAM-dependent methyltransferase n=1 Tax=Streptomyces sp. V4I23 TaxID=3042282 RepID=UPI002788240E|nr:SAM-dependent methyltransferase [Streptomyces sp. V4I23]